MPRLTFRFHRPSIPSPPSHDLATALANLMFKSQMRPSFASRLQLPHGAKAAPDRARRIARGLRTHVHHLDSDGQTAWKRPIHANLWPTCCRDVSLHDAMRNSASGHHERAGAHGPWHGIQLTERTGRCAMRTSKSLSAPSHQVRGGSQHASRVSR